MPATPPAHRAGATPLAATPLAATLLAAALLSAACARRTEPPPPAAPAGVVTLGDGVTATSVASGVVHRTLTLANGPRVVHVLDVDRSRCWSLVARKAGTGAVGRAGTLALLSILHDSATVAGGVNADFFSFAPPGVPQSAHVQRGRVLAGPSARPVLAFDSTG